MSSNPGKPLVALIDELRDVLEDERRALLSGTAHAINAVTERKLMVAGMIEAATGLADAPKPALATLVPLARYNRENAVICEAMLRHLTAAIDRLRRHEAHRSYGPDGSEHYRSARHPLGAA